MVSILSLAPQRRLSSFRPPVFPHRGFVIVLDETSLGNGHHARFSGSAVVASHVGPADVAGSPHA